MARDCPGASTNPLHPSLGYARMFRYGKGRFGVNPAPPKGIRPNNSRARHKKKRPKNPSQAGPLPRQQKLRTILGEIRILRQEGVRLLDALLDCRWESHDGLVSLRMWLVLVTSYGHVRQFVLTVMMEGDRTENSYPSHCPFDVIKKATIAEMMKQNAMLMSDA